MRLIRSLALLLALIAPAWADAQQLANCATGIPCSVGGPTNTKTGDNLPAAGAKFNADVIDLYAFLRAPITGPVSIAPGTNTSVVGAGVLTNSNWADMPASAMKCNPTGTAAAPTDCTPTQVNSILGTSTSVQLAVNASGDTSGVTDEANLQAAFATLAASTRLPPLAGQYYATNHVFLQPGTFYFTTSLGNILRSSALKTQGVWIQCSGRGVTNIDYNPTTSGPFITNNHGLDVMVTGCTFTGHDAASDWLWSQEQAGVTNVQDYTLQDNEWNGIWNNLYRLTGGNNNSEWKLDRNTGSGSFNNGFYVPPAVVATISSGSNTISATNTAEQIEVGDTGFFSASVAPATINTQYYVISASTSTFQVATCATCSAISFTASGTPNFQTGNDQFLNFWVNDQKWDTGTSLGQLFTLNFGGHVHIRNLDVSKHEPSSAGGCLFNLGSTLNNGVHSGGVMDFEVSGRIEIESDNVCVMHSNWWRGSIVFNNWDESSQAGNRTISNVYATYNFQQNGGPTVIYRDSQLMGTHNYINNTNNNTYQQQVNYENVTLLDNPSFAHFITMTNNGNTGGYPIIHCHPCRNYLVSSSVGYREVVDSDLNYQFAANGTFTTHHASCLNTNSDWPISSGSFEVRLPLNAMITSINYSNPTGSSSGGAYDYLIETTDSTPVVLLTVAGASATTPVPTSTPVTSSGTGTANYLVTTDTARTLKIIDTTGRSGVMTGVRCSIDYIGDLSTPLHPINDEHYDARAAA